MHPRKSIVAVLLAIAFCFSGFVFLGWNVRAAETTGETDSQTVDEPSGGEGQGEASHDDDAQHDPYDLSHANAGPQQEDVAEIRESLAFWTFIVFCLMLLVLGKFAWGPIAQALDRREAGIANQMAEAQRSNEEAKQLLAQHEAKLAGAANEVRAMIDEARKDADSQKQKILSEAQAAAAAEKDRAVREIDAAKNIALEELAQRSVDTAVGLAGQIVRRDLRADDHAQLIQDALKKFPSDN